jgi:thymidine kinase
MFSGKSSEILKIINRYKSIEKKILVINHKINNRYGSVFLSTHDKNFYNDCIVLEYLSELKKIDYHQYDVIIIDELQFFEDALVEILFLVEYEKKIVICSGLDGDFERKPFGDVLKLIPFCDRVTKLSALCSLCKNGNLAHFSKRISSENKQTHVGDINSYLPVCRLHFLDSL